MSLSKYKVIFWDFDGVLLDSNSIRDIGFQKVLKDFPKKEVEDLLSFHRENGGLSRYVKFRYFFENIRREKISDYDILKLSDSFSIIMRELLLNRELLIQQTLDFVKLYYGKIEMYIVSGSDQNELRFLCDELLMSIYFKGIYGSPTPKNELVSNILNHNNFELGQCILIGDSINDYEAAKHNKIHFLSFNNPSLIYLDDINYIF
jgi:hypothetical protein